MNGLHGRSRLISMIVAAIASRALGTSYEPTSLPRLIDASVYVLGITIQKAEVFDHVGRRMSDPDIRMGPDSGLWVRLHVRIVKEGVIRRPRDIKVKDGDVLVIYPNRDEVTSVGAWTEIANSKAVWVFFGDEKLGAAYGRDYLIQVDAHGRCLGFPKLFEGAMTFGQLRSMAEDRAAQPTAPSDADEMKRERAEKKRTTSIDTTVPSGR